MLRNKVRLGQDEKEAQSMKNTRMNESKDLMRSLSAIAEKKGWMKEEVVSVKKASFVSGNLLQDIMTLSSELRGKGFDTYANEIEANYFKFAKAESALYSNPDGNKEITNAHPEGSVELDIEGDAVMETVIDRHLAMLDVVNKQPKGKLTTAQAINEVKKVFGQASERLDKIPLDTFLDSGENGAAYIISYVNRVKQIIQKVISENQISANVKDGLTEALNSLNKYSLKEDYENNAGELSNIAHHVGSLIQESAWGLDPASTKHVNKTLKDIVWMLSDYARQVRKIMFNRGVENVPTAPGKPLAGYETKSEPAVTPNSPPTESVAAQPSAGTSIESIKKDFGGPVAKEAINQLVSKLIKSMNDAQKALQLIEAHKPDIDAMPVRAKQWLQVIYPKYASECIGIFSAILTNLSQAKDITELKAGAVTKGVAAKELSQAIVWKTIVGRLEKRMTSLDEVTSDANEACNAIQ